MAPRKTRAELQAMLDKCREERNEWMQRALACEEPDPPPVDESPGLKGIAVPGGFQNMDATTRGKELDAAKDLGCQWFRAGIDIGSPDRGITVGKEVRARGMKFLGTLTAGRQMTPMEMAGFAGSVAGAADAFEVWNEPNLVSFWKGKPNPQAYAALYQAAKGALKAARPDVTVVSGGLSPADDANLDNAMSPGRFLQAAIAYGMEPDAIGWHPYGSYKETLPSDMLDWSAWTQAVKQPQWGKIPFWGTEWGAPTKGIDPAVVTEAHQAAIYEDGLTLWKSYQDAGIPNGPLFGYMLRDLDPATNPQFPSTSREFWYGLCRNDWSRKPAYDKYKGVTV